MLLDQTSCEIFNVIYKSALQILTVYSFNLQNQAHSVNNVPLNCKHKMPIHMLQGGD